MSSDGADADADCADVEPAVTTGVDVDADADADSSAAAESGTADDERDDAHLQDIEDGCGCAEVWEHLSERREAAGDD
jgi:hypothetical protein